MKIGIGGVNAGPYGDPELVVRLAAGAEKLGFESIWTIEHIAVAKRHGPYPGTPDGQVPGGDTNPISEPLIHLAYAAAATSKLKLATGAILLPLHHPLYLAKQIATLDVLSHGRVMLGIANGWMKEEFGALGVDFHARGTRTDEAIAAMRALWRDSSASFHGRQFQFDEMISFPKPVQKDRIPIHIGGNTPVAQRRAGRVGDGYFPTNLIGGFGRLKEAIDLVRRTAREHGRDPDRIEITTIAPASLDEMKAYRDAGVSRLIMRAPEASQLRAELEKIADGVLAKL
jgi:probable F420-dependent oxidoreductase